MDISRKTKIIATIGPTSDSPEVLTRLIESGMNAARLNFSHETQAVHQKRIRLVRTLEKKLGAPIAIVADLQGPKMRIGKLPTEGIILHEGDEILLDTSTSEYHEGVIPVPSEAFARGIRKGSFVFLDDGSLMLEITTVPRSLSFGRHRYTSARVMRGGMLYSHKGVNVPQLRLRTEIFEKKDRSDFAFALRQKVDYVALSFLRTAKDVDVARAMAKGKDVKLIAKIERHEALEHLETIIERVDAVMVARGDLGIETPLWELPHWQKEIILKAHAQMRPVIVATQMLESMTRNIIPTRAEVSDVANAVYDGADAVMLSAETAAGRHPLEAVRTMKKIILATEKHVGNPFVKEIERFTSTHIAVAKSTKYTASQVGAKVIVVGTATGASARAVSRYRPSTPIVAVARNAEVARSLGIVWGMHPVVLTKIRSVSDMLEQSIKYLKKQNIVAKGDRVVCLAGKRLGEAGRTNTLSVVLVP